MLEISLTPLLLLGFVFVWRGTWNPLKNGQTCVAQYVSCIGWWQLSNMKYGGVWGVDPRILNLGRLIPAGRAPLYPFDREKGGSHCRLWRCAGYISASAKIRTQIPQSFIPQPPHCINKNIPFLNGTTAQASEVRGIAKNTYTVPLFIVKKPWQRHSYFEPAEFLQRSWL